MKTNRLALWGIVSVLVCSGVFCASSEGFGGRNRPVPSAMHYSNYENNGFGIDPYAGYSPNVQMINPRSGPTPFQYRQWHARAFEETTGIPAPVGGYRLGRTVPSIGRIYREEMGSGGGSFNYAPSVVEGRYNQQFVGDGCFDVCYDPCFDPCAVPCFTPCPPMAVPVTGSKHCILNGIKNFFSHIFHRKGFCASSKFTTDPWFGTSAYYSPAPMMASWSGGDFGDYNYYDGGYAGGSYSSGTSSCCGGGGDSFTGGSYSNSYDSGFSDNGLGVDMNSGSAPAPAMKPAPGPAPADVDAPRAGGST